MTLFLLFLSSSLTRLLSCAFYFLTLFLFFFFSSPYCFSTFGRSFFSFSSSSSCTTHESSKEKKRLAKGKLHFRDWLRAFDLRAVSRSRSLCCLGVFAHCRSPSAFAPNGALFPFFSDQFPCLLTSQQGVAGRSICVQRKTVSFLTGSTNTVNMSFRFFNYRLQAFFPFVIRVNMKTRGESDGHHVTQIEGVRRKETF